MDATLTAGGSTEVTVRHQANLKIGGAVAVAGGQSGAASFTDDLSVSAASVTIESGSALVGVAETVDMTGADGVRVGSTGATVEL
eukprot:COSAG02_NODE_67615_length_252_cov_1.013072_1_plen_84_part_11